MYAKLTHIKMEKSLVSQQPEEIELGQSHLAALFEIKYNTES